MRQYIIDEITATRDVMSQLLADTSLLSEVERITEVCIDALKDRKKILFAGNGGSAADSQHLAAELVSRLRYNRPGLAGIALTTDTSALTAIGNDYAFEEIFSRQIEAIGNAGDIFIGISTSGNSANILSALATAHKQGMITVGFAGKTGGKMSDFCDYLLKTPSTCTPKIQECHITLGHIICAMIEEALFGEQYNPERNK